MCEGWLGKRGTFGRVPVSILGNEREIAAVRHLIAPSLGQGILNADENIVVDTDYIENGIAALEGYLAAKAEDSSLALV